MGEFVHILAGGILGPVMFLILTIYGYDYAMIKGAGFGAVMWIVHIINDGNAEYDSHMYRMI